MSEYLNFKFQKNFKIANFIFIIIIYLFIYSHCIQTCIIIINYNSFPPSFKSSLAAFINIFITIYHVLIVVVFYFFFLFFNDIDHRVAVERARTLAEIPEYEASLLLASSNSLSSHLPYLSSLDPPPFIIHPVNPINAFWTLSFPPNFDHPTKPTNPGGGLIFCTLSIECTFYINRKRINPPPGLVRFGG